MYKRERFQVPIETKANLTLDEASVYFNIGRQKLRELSNDPNCRFVLFVGEKRLIKRRLFEEYLDGMYSV